LFYNDYNAEDLNENSVVVYDLVDTLINEDIPIDGVGLQLHLSIMGQNFRTHQNKYKLMANINRLGNLGLKVHITEMDVLINDLYTKTYKEKLDAEALVYNEVFKSCLEEDACEALVTWGATDKYSWVYNYYKENFDIDISYPDEAPLLFDEYYAPKPAYYEMIDNY